MSGLCKFQPDDMLKIQLHPKYAGLRDILYQTVCEWYAKSNEAARFWSLTIYEGDRVWGVGGIITGRAWAFLDDEMHTRPDLVIKVTRGVRELLRLHSDYMGPVTTRVDPDVPHALRWAQALGFEPTASGKWVYDASI